MCIILRNFHMSMGWNFILQGDEKQGMILIQDEGMDFQSSYIWICIKFSINLWDNISCLKGVDHRVCFPAWDRMEISYHHEMPLVGKFLLSRIELTVPVRATLLNIPKQALCEMRLMVWLWSGMIRNSKGVVGWDRHVTPNIVEYPKRTQLGCPLSSY